MAESGAVVVVVGTTGALVAGQGAASEVVSPEPASASRKERPLMMMEGLLPGVLACCRAWRRVTVPSVEARLDSGARLQGVSRCSLSNGGVLHTILGRA